MVQKRKPYGKKNNQINYQKKILSFIFNLLFYVIMISIFLGASLLTVMQQQDKSLNGYRVFGVLTNSMVSPDNTLKKGGFRAGDILVIKEVKAKDLKVGDVVTYHPSTNPKSKKNNYLTHRVVKIQNGLKGEKGYFITTRGDANRTDDMPVSERALVGKVVGKIPKVGAILTYIKENFILSIIFILSVVGFIWVIKMYIVSEDNNPVDDKKSKKSKKKSKTSSHNKKKTKTSSHAKKSKTSSHKKKSSNKKKKKIQKSKGQSKKASKN